MLRRLAACRAVELIPGRGDRDWRDPDRADLALKWPPAPRLLASAEARFGAMREEAGIGRARLVHHQIAIVLVAHHEQPHRGVARKVPAGRAFRHPADA